MFRWMFGKRGADGRGDGNRIYRVLFWLLLIGVAVTLVAIYFKECLYLVLAFIGGALCGILLERRRRRRLLREAELEDSGGLLRRKKKPGGKDHPAEKQPPAPSPAAETPDRR